MNVSESAPAQVLFPFRWQPRADRDAIEVRFEVHTFIFSYAGCSLAVDASVALRVWRKIDSVNGEQRTSEEKMGAAQIEIWRECHLQRTPSRAIFEVRAVWRDEQLRAEKARPLAAELPGYICRFGFNPLQKHPVRQKNCEPRLRLDCFGVRLLNLDFNVARLDAHFVELPLPHKQPPRIEPGGDALSVE
jgi:hypothetical protein